MFREKFIGIKKDALIFERRERARREAPLTINGEDLLQVRALREMYRAPDHGVAGNAAFEPAVEDRSDQLDLDLLPDRLTVLFRLLCRFPPRKVGAANGGDASDDGAVADRHHDIGAQLADCRRPFIRLSILPDNPLKDG